MKSNASVSVIIPAAGSSSRFKSSSRGKVQSKIYETISGEPLIARSIRVFASHPRISEIIVALPKGGEKEFKRLIMPHFTSEKPIHLVRGGATRAASVQNALKRVSKKSVYVCVHDAARPFLEKKWIELLLGSLNGFDGAVLGKAAVSTIKKVNEHTGCVEETLDRKELFEAETPQLLKKDALIRAYQTLGKNAFQLTDDSSLVERSGGKIKTVLHTGTNSKITTHEDLELARKLTNPNSSLRFGLGSDGHALVPGRIFYLGGVKLKASFGPLGHSDGDPLLHAITDGVLGALGLGDIGDFFSDQNSRWRGARSHIFLNHALKLASKKGYQPFQIDATVFLDEPKLGAVKEKIRSSIAKHSFLSLDRVNIKAKTLEGFRAQANRKSVSCEALVVLEPISK